MAGIPAETIKTVLEQTDIVELINSYIPLKRAGSNFTCCCPFHNEKTPSFSVNPSRQFFHCFGCKESGDAIAFVQKYENLPFVDAVKKLASKVNVTIVEAAYDPRQDKLKRTRSRLIQLHNEAAAFFHQQIRKSPAAKHARAYLQQRGFDAAMAEKWLIGWMPEDPSVFTQWAKTQGYNGRELCDSGLAALRDQNNPSRGLYVRFQNRLMFPIHNDYGDTIAFSGRQLVADKKSGKYINSPQTSIFDKSRVFFALDKARRHMSKAGFALICEGQIDAIACHQSGFENAIAPLGTAFTEHHARLLKRYTNVATLCFDADTAGYKAIEKAFRILAPADIHVRCITMPEGDDPDSFIQKNGTEAFAKLTEEAKEFFDYKLSIDAKTKDLSNVQTKTQLAHELSELTALVPDKIAQDAIIQQIASRLIIPETLLRESTAKAITTQHFEKKRAAAREQRANQHIQSQQHSSPSAPPALPAQPVEVTITPLDSVVATLCSLTLGSAAAQEHLCEQFEPLIEPLQSAQGGHLLIQLLKSRPDSDSASAVMAYLSTLAPPDRDALLKTLAYRIPEDPVRAATEASNMLINIHFQNKESALRAALSQPDLSDEEVIAYQRELIDLQKILSNLSQRFIR